MAGRTRQGAADYWADAVRAVVADATRAEAAVSAIAAALAEYRQGGPLDPLSRRAMRRQAREAQAIADAAAALEAALLSAARGDPGLLTVVAANWITTLRGPLRAVARRARRFAVWAAPAREGRPEKRGRNVLCGCVGVALGDAGVRLTKARDGALARILALVLEATGDPVPEDLFRRGVALAVDTWRAALDARALLAGRQQVSKPPEKNP